MRETRYAKMMLLSVAALGSAVPVHAAEELGEIVVTVNCEETHRTAHSSVLPGTGCSARREGGRTPSTIARATKVSAEGEAFPGLVPPGTPQADIPVRPDILTVGEDETEIGWQSDVLARNRWGVGTAGLRIQQIDLDFYRQTPQAYDSDFSRGELSYAAYVEQLFRLAEQARSYAQFLALEMQYHSFHSCPRMTVREVFVPLVQRAALGRAKAQQD